MLEIRIERLNHAQERRIEFLFLYERDPVALPDLSRNVVIGNTRRRTGTMRLPSSPAVRDFLFAVLRVHCVGRYDEQERGLMTR